MAVSVSVLLADNDNGNLAAYTFNSFTWSANDCLVCVAANSDTGTSGDTVPTLTTTGITWVENTAGRISFSGMDLWVFRAKPGSGGTQAPVLDFGLDAQIGASILVFKITDGDATGTNGENIIGQAKTSSGTGTSGDLSTMSYDAIGSSGVVACFSFKADEAFAQEAGWTLLHNGGTSNGASNSTRHTNPPKCLGSGYKNAADTSPTGTWTTSVDYAGVSLELKSASTSSTYTKAGLGVIGP